MVCHIPKPIRGVTPRYKPFMPFSRYTNARVLKTVSFAGRLALATAFLDIDCIW
jgi:hypothetical protein